MNEGGGGLSSRTNVMWRSSNGGASLDPDHHGIELPCCWGRHLPEQRYFAKVNPIWRHMGWGEPAVGPNNVIHYVFAGHGSGSDNGDVFYTRSTDNGATWSAPIKLNDDTDAQYKVQWMPSLSVNPSGRVTASWYDRRSVSTACNAATDPGCNYERYGAQSPDNGITWGANFAISSSIIPQPQQQDGGVQTATPVTTTTAPPRAAMLTLPGPMAAATLAACRCRTLTWRLCPSNKGPARPISDRRKDFGAAIRLPFFIALLVGALLS